MSENSNNNTMSSMLDSLEILAESPDDGKIVLAFGDLPQQLDTWLDDAESTLSEVDTTLGDLTELREDMARAVEAAGDAKDDAETQAVNAEAWAVGTRGGTDVSTEDETYHNNSKYYAEQTSTGAAAAAASASAAATSAGAAAGSASDAASSANESAVSAAAASASATAAFSSQTSAASSATAAAASQAAASTSATSASNSAASASSSATSASGSATAAAASASAAAQSAQDAEDVLDSIPPDYTTTVQEVTELKSAFNDLLDAIFTDAFLKLTKASDAFTVEVNHYANSYGKQELSGYNLYYFTAQKDFECYCDEATLQNGQALSIGIYNGDITQSGFVKQYRRSDNNLPTIANKATINAGQIFAVSIYTPSSSPEDFGIYANYKYDTLNNDVKLSTNQIDQVLNEINPKTEEIATAGYKPYQKLTKSSQVFTAEENTYATTGDKVTLSGYLLLYFTAQTDFDFYFDANTLGETFGLFFSVYNNSIASGNNVYCKRRSSNDLPSESNKAHVSNGQIVAISIYTPSSSPADFVAYANYQEFLQLTNNVYLNQTQIEQAGGSASYKNYAYNKKIAWFGDSISEMRQLPHTTGNLLSATVYDCSFRGSCIGRTYSNYNEFSFSHLVTSIIAGDFSAQWTQLEAKEQEEGHAMPWLRENLTTLESLDFSEIDYVVLLQGTNDFGIPINAQSPYTSRVAEMKGLMDDAIGRLITFAPQIKFYIFTPFYRGDITEDNYHNTIADYVNAEIEVAEKYAIPADNLLTNSRICQQNRTTYLNSTDLVHPNEYGDNYLAEICAKFIGTL